MMNKIVKAKVWLELGQGISFCHGKAKLLSAIDKFGSIRRATQNVNISYKRAWRYIRELESGLGCKILSTTIGGADGGGAQLTEAGQHLLHEYESAKAQIDLTLQEHVESFSRSF